MKLLITGATHGIGRGVARAIAAADKAHEVIILCRSRNEGEETCASIKQTTGNKNTSIVICDLMYMDQVRRAIATIKEKHHHLDGIFINAGIGYSATHVFAANQIDAHFQVNYLSQFFLTLELQELVARSELGGRIVFNTTKTGTLHWQDLQLTKKWSFIKAIEQTMAAKRLFYKALHARLQQKYGEDAPSAYGYCVHKSVWTNQSNIIPGYMKAMVHTAKLFGAFITEQECGEIMAKLFTEPRQFSASRSGKLISWHKGEFNELKDNDLIHSEEAQQQLWDLSLKLSRAKTYSTAAFN